MRSEAAAKTGPDRWIRPMTSPGPDSRPPRADWLRAMPDDFPVAVAVWRAGDGALLFANRRFGTLFGFPGGSLRAGAISDLLAATSGDVGQLTAVPVGEGVREVEVPCRGADGTAFHVLASLTPVPFGAEPEAVLGAFHRLGAGSPGGAQAAEDARAVAELARFPEMNPGPVLRLDRSGLVRLANGAARALFGGGALLGRRWLELCPDTDPDLWGRVLAGGAPISCEAEIGERCVIFTFVRSDAGDSVFAFGADITERRRAEHQLAEQTAELAEVARFPDMNPGPVLRLDLEGNVLLANVAARRVFGEDLVGRGWSQLCPGIDGAAWRTVLEAREPVPCEARVGSCEYVFTHRRDPDSRLVFVFGADVSAQKRAERALRQSEKMATLGTLAAGVAHEINNPAAAARRAAEQLREAFARHEEAHVRLGEVRLTARGREALDALESLGRGRGPRPKELDALDRADREARIEEWLQTRGVADPWELAPALASMDLDLPALDRLAEALEGEALAAGLAAATTALPLHALLHEIGQATARVSEIVGVLRSYTFLGEAPVQEVDLHEGLDNTLAILRGKLEPGIRVTRDYGRDVPPVPAYGSELNQVWTHLLDNAADALRGRGRIAIRTRRKADYVVVDVEDDGPGIPEAELSRIFDPFFTTKPPGKGTGLGLATSYGIITEKHGGEMAVESRPGFTRFTVRLPLAPPPPVREPGPVPSPRSPDA